MCRIFAPVYRARKTSCEDRKTGSDAAGDGGPEMQLPEIVSVTGNAINSKNIMREKVGKKTILYAQEIMPHFIFLITIYNTLYLGSLLL